MTVKGPWRVRRYNMCLEAIKDLKIGTTKDVVEWQVKKGYHHTMTISEACWYMKQLVLEGKCKREKQEHKAAVYRWY